MKDGKPGTLIKLSFGSKEPKEEMMKSKKESESSSYSGGHKSFLMNLINELKEIPGTEEVIKLIQDYLSDEEPEESSEKEKKEEDIMEMMARAMESRLGK